MWQSGSQITAKSLQHTRQHQLTKKPSEHQVLIQPWWLFCSHFSDLPEPLSQALMTPASVPSEPGASQEEKKLYFLVGLWEEGRRQEKNKEVLVWKCSAFPSIFEITFFTFFIVYSFWASHPSWDCIEGNQQRIRVFWEGFERDEGGAVVLEMCQLSPDHLKITEP